MVENRITVNDAAKILESTTSWVYDLIRRGKLTEHRLGEGSIGRNKEGVIMLDRQEVERRAEEQKKEAARASS